MTTANQIGAPWGAGAEAWTHFADHLGLREDLLPVVSNPQARVSARSALRQIGKVPSRYNNDREVVGMPAWTSHRATERDVERWQRDSDYGICIQTRVARAIDIDVQGAELAQRIRETVELILGPLPARVRSNSSKCLLAFKLEGSWQKRVLRTEHGPIEFLGTGQQFIGVGTHPSGVRYEWEGGLPDSLDWVTAAEFEALWAALGELYAVSAMVGRPGAVRPTVARTAGDVAPSDDVLAYLERGGWVRSFDSQGRAHITCPWEHEHSDAGEGSESATTYFPAGVGGFAQGHFRCLHAHCEHRRDGDFLEAVGYVQADFAALEPAPGEAEPPLALPPFERDRAGRILSSVGNLEMALRRGDVAGVHIGYDAFSDEIMAAPWGTQDWRPFTDADYTRLRIRLESGPTGFCAIGREMIRDVVAMVAQDKRFDSAQVWLDGLRWDGRPRIERFLADYFGAELTEYARAVALYVWTAMAGRVLDPGCQADMVPIFVGDQGVGKSTGVAAMVPAPEHFMEVRLDEAEETLARRMRAKLIGEIGELRGMASREIEHIKAFVTRRHEEWVPKYREFAVKFPRRLVFIGTTNADEFLGDETGNRRWLPVRVGQVDREAIARDRDQLWAEAAVRWLAEGVVWMGVEEQAAPAHEEHRIVDAWEETIARWLEEPAGVEGDGRNRDGLVRTTAVLSSALGLVPSQVTRREQLRVAKVLRALGGRKTRARVDGVFAQMWAF